MVYIITGGPATGKGTRSEILSKALNIPHISTGEILRDVATRNEEINYKLTKGILIPDEKVTEFLMERLEKKDCKNGFILDGYPRTLAQVNLLNEVLKKLGTKVDRVIELVIPDELAFRRILERRSCVNWTDDTEETLKKRIETYRKNSKDILDYYKKEGLLKTVDASSHSERIVEEATVDDYKI